MSVVEHCHDAALGQNPMAGGEGQCVLIAARTVDRAIDRHHSGKLQEWPQWGDLEQGRFSQKARIPAECGHQEETVNKSVSVIGHDNNGSGCRKVLGGLHLNPSKEDMNEQPSETSHSPVRHSPHERDAMWRDRLCRGIYEIVRISAPLSVFISVRELLALLTTPKFEPLTTAACGLLKR